MAQQIAASNLTNRSRLRILNARQEVLDGIFEEARQKLPDVQKDKAKYGELLKDLILEVQRPLTVRWVDFAGAVCLDGEGSVHSGKEGGQ